MTVLEAGWAVWSKRPDENAGYSILACSKGPFSPSQYEAILRRYSLGTPSSTETGPGALPWVTISGFALKGGQPYIGIAIETWTGQVDGVKRPISTTAFYCVPYQDMCGGKVAYTALHQAVTAVPLPESGADHQQVKLRVPALDLATLVRDIEPDVRACAEEVAALLLLGRRVTVMGGDHLCLDDRLRFLDAVGAVLPYGYRAYATAATWARDSARRVRVTFGTSGRDGSTALRWPSTRPAGPAQIGSGYLHKLREMYEHGWTPEGVVNGLTMFIDPAKPEDPEHAMEALTTLDWPFDLLRRSRRAEVEPEEIQRFFRTERFQELDHAGQVEAFLYLISSGGGLDGWKQAKRLQDMIIGDDTPKMRGAIAEATRALLWKSSRQREIQEYLRHARERGFVDGLLGAAIRPPADAVPRVGLRYAARLIDDWVLATADLAAYPSTLAALVETPSVACELVAQLMEAGKQQDLDRAIAWLHLDLEETLRPFLALWDAKMPPVSAADCGQLARGSPDCVLALLRTAAQLNRMGRVLPGFRQWLVDGAVLQKSDRRFWAAGRKELPQLPPDLQGLLDPLLLTAGTFDTPATGSAWTIDEWRVYVQSFMRTWNEPWIPDNRALLAAGLEASLNRLVWQNFDPSAEATASLVLKLLRSNHSTLDWSGVLREAYGALAAIGDGPKDSAVAGLVAWLKKNHRDLARPRSRTTAEATSTPAEPPVQSVDVLLGRLTEMFGHNPGEPGSALSQFAREARPASAKDAVELINAFRYWLGRSGSARADIDAWLDRLGNQLCVGAFGADIADEGAALLREQLTFDLLSQVHLLDWAAQRTDDGRARLTEPQRRRLEWARDVAAAVAKEAKKNEPGRKRGMLHHKNDTRTSAPQPGEDRG